ncbi:uncharacterized protein ARMOST_20743 [Armillaria ostoyae]|uniref:Uncharacterized protein n=1 Tax=Armillaria ostoyae TaxID=47428 RepID=A0A284S858_ARMOS|nr:uncharacterized protein ARMOST_20743 [Armillaria ostoyae]
MHSNYQRPRRQHNRVSSTLAEQSSILGLEFFAMVVVLHRFAHGASNAYHLGIPEQTRCFVDREANTRYRLDTAFFGGIIGVVFQSGTTQDPQLPDIAYFMIRSRAGKAYKVDIEQAAAWITATEGRIAPFDFDVLEEMKMDGQYFLTHACAFVNAAYAPVNIQPRLRYHAPYRLGRHIVLPPRRH